MEELFKFDCTWFDCSDIVQIQIQNIVHIFISEEVWPYGADDINEEENDIGGGHRPHCYGDACQHLQVKMEFRGSAQSKNGQLAIFVRPLGSNNVHITSNKNKQISWIKTEAFKTWTPSK